jgi:hypothetical protein
MGVMASLSRQLRWVFVPLVAVATAVWAPAMPYGVNAHIPSAPLLDAIAGAGISWVRIDMLWDHVELAQDSFDWSTYDTVVANAAARGLRLYATISSTPAWATDGLAGRGAPRSAKDFYDFCYRAAARYRGRIDHWGMWNEPNQPQFWQGSRQQYLDLILVPGSQAVHDANPLGRVCGPELAHLVSANWDRWLADVLDRASASLDIVTHHLYPDGADAGSVVNALTRDGYSWEPPSVRSVLTGHGWTGRPVWLTETGVSVTFGNLPAEAVQGAFVADLLARLFGPQRSVNWIGKVFFYEATDDLGASPNLWGLFTAQPELRPRAAAVLYHNFVAATAVDDAELANVEIPAALQPGELATAHVTVRNTGTAAWNAAAGYRLGAVGDSDPLGPVRVDLDPVLSVPPDATYTFAVPLTAPLGQTPPDAPLATDWQMVREGKWWFGEVARRQVTITAGPSLRARYVVPGLANAPGRNGTFWRADLALFNPAQGESRVRLLALESGRDNTYPRSVALSLPPRTSVRINDVLPNLFGLAGSAALRIEVDAGEVVTTARSYTAGGGGYVGGSVPALPTSVAITPGADARIAGLRSSPTSDHGSRTNLGFVNLLPAPVTVSATLVDDDGTLLEPMAVDLPASGFIQLGDVFRSRSAAEVGAGTAIVRVSTSGGAVVAYASVVDNITGDATILTPSQPSTEPAVVFPPLHNADASAWRSDLALTSSVPIAARIAVAMVGARPAAAPAVALSLDAGATLHFPDVITSLFGAGLQGGLWLSAPRGGVLATNWSYRARGAGAVGGAMPLVGLYHGAHQGDEVRLVGLAAWSRATTGAHTDIGMVNLTPQPIQIDVALYRTPASYLVTFSYRLEPFGTWSIEDAYSLVPVAGSDGWAVLSTPTPGGSFAACAWVVDNVTGDPVIIPGQ